VTVRLPMPSSCNASWSSMAAKGPLVPVERARATVVARRRSASMQLRRVRGPVLDTLYARLRRRGDVASAGRPFIEHSTFPVLTIDTPDPRPYRYEPYRYEPYRYEPYRYEPYRYELCDGPAGQPDLSLALADHAGTEIGRLAVTRSGSTWIRVTPRGASIAFIVCSCKWIHG